MIGDPHAEPLSTSVLRVGLSGLSAVCPLSLWVSHTTPPPPKGPSKKNACIPKSQISWGHFRCWEDPDEWAPIPLLPLITGAHLSD